MLNFLKTIGASINHDLVDYYEGYIRFLGKKDESILLFWEEASCHINLISIDIFTTVKTTTKIIASNVVSVNHNDEFIAILKEKPNSISVYNLKLDLLHECLLKNDFRPIFVELSNSEILIVGTNGTFMIYDASTFDLRHSYDLRDIELVKPMFVLPSKIHQDQYYIIDSSNHVIKRIDKSKNILWSYGKFNLPSSDITLLNSPIFISECDEYIYISEQRNHRVLALSQTGKFIYCYGVTGYVGTVEGRLWAPQGIVINKNLYIIMCKGGNISMSAIDKNNNIKQIYGTNVILSSNLNFQRSCEFSPKHNLVLVADTYHNRIVAFDAFTGNEEFEITEFSEEKLHWPRCAIWNNDMIVICDSRNQRIIECDMLGVLKDVIHMNRYYDTTEWIQSIQINNDELLVCYESNVLILDMKTKNLLWDAKSQGRTYRDVHFATYNTAVGQSGIIVSDTGNNRVVFDNFSNIQVVENILTDSGESVKLSKPRFARIVDEILYIANSRASQIFAVNCESFKIIQIYGGKRGCGENRLSKPRWLCSINEKYLYFSDTDNHRLVVANKPKA